MNYRKDIDGLRALAVLPVIFFHAGFSLFSGGYIGVDIFFVISGYLITSIILADLAKHNFSIITFYERRARRILPALSAVLIWSMFMGYIFMPAELLKSLSQSLVSVITFSSNVYFYLTIDYFSSASDEMPLLHTWSLAVEEQYYLFFPLLMVALWKFGKLFSLISLLVIAMLSLFLAQYLSSQNMVNVNFYLIFSRAWELLAGSVLAFLMMKKFKVSTNVREALSIIGFVMIVYAIVAFDEQTPFPSFYTLIPVIGTVLIIGFSDENSYIGQLLSQKLIVFIGLISYSLYLWHQPIFAFMRLKTIGEPSEIYFAGAISITFIAAYISWKYIEKPFRNKQKFDRKSIFKLSVGVITCFFVIGMIGHYNKGFEERFNVRSYSDSISSSPKRLACHTKGTDYLKPKEGCEFFSKNVTWATLGDSHTVEIAYALAKKLQNQDIGLKQLSFSGCPPSLYFESDVPGCHKWFKESLSYLEESSTIENVLVGFSYSSFLFGDHLNSYPKTPNEDSRLNVVNLEATVSNDELRELYWNGVLAAIDRLQNSGKRVYILYPLPELPIHINKAIFPFSIFGNEPTLDLKESSTKDYYMTRHQYILSKLGSLKYADKLVAVKPFDILCSSGTCPAIINDKSIYFDDNHLSVFGAKLLVENIF